MIPFNAANYDSFKEALELVGRYGSGFKPPSMYELRVPFLIKKVEEVENQLVEHKTEWAAKGCSIMSDGWRDSVVQKDIINFLVNSPKGSVFIKSVDVSEAVKDTNLLFSMLDRMVDEVGEANVVQVVTDNASNYVKAGKFISVQSLCVFDYVVIMNLNESFILLIRREAANGQKTSSILASLCGTLH